MKIGEVASLVGIRVDSVRYYERRGLLPKPERTAAGYRTYGQPTVERLRLARQLQELGFTLDEIVELLVDIDAGVATCASERPRFATVLERVDGKIAALVALRRRLATTLKGCANGRCTILDERNLAGPDAPAAFRPPATGDGAAKRRPRSRG